MIDWPKQNTCYMNAYEPLIYREYCNQITLVTDFHIVPKDVPSDISVPYYHAEARKKLEGVGHIVGFGVSATAVYPGTEQDRYMQTSVSIERLPEGSRYRGKREGSQVGMWDIDIRDDYTSSNMRNEIKRLWRLNPSPVYFIDNAFAHSALWGNAPFTWEDAMEYIENLRVYANRRLNARCVFNIAMHAFALTEVEIARLIKAIGTDIICLEIPLHENIRNNPDILAKHTANYHKLFEAGVGFCWIPLENTTEEILWDYQAQFKYPDRTLYIVSPITRPPNPILLGEVGQDK